MQSNQKQTSSDKNQKNRSRGLLWAGAVLVVVLVLLIGSALAKYVASNRRRAEMESAPFHISSNYLEDPTDDKSYTVVDWGNGFDILLYNYEKENIAQISEMNMTYQIKVTSGNASVEVSQDGEKLNPDAVDGSYTFAKSSTTSSHVLHVIPNADVPATITIEVATTAPYAKTLKANFTIQNNHLPDYTIEDQGDTILVTVRSNDYVGTMKIKWDEAKYSPDNTNPLMDHWQDSSDSSSFGTFIMERNYTYELLFFKKTSDAYTQTTGTGTQIVLN